MLSGFQISGNVLNGDKESLALGLYDEKGELLEKTKCTKDGRYHFIVKPGGDKNQWKIVFFFVKIIGILCVI